MYLWRIFLDKSFGFVLLIWNRIPLHSLSCPGTYHVDQFVLKLTDIPRLHLLNAGIGGVCHQAWLLIGSFEVRRPILNLGLLLAAHIYFFPASPHSWWQIHLSCPWVIPLLVLEPSHLGFQHRLETGCSRGLPRDSSTRLRPPRQPHGLNNYWALAFPSASVGLLEPQPVSHSNRPPFNIHEQI